MHHTRYLLVFAVLLLGSCQAPQVAKPGATTAQTAPVPQAQSVTDTAQADLERKAKELAERLRANVDHARESNQGNPDGAPKTVVDGDLEVAQGLMGDVKADPVEYAARQRDQVLVESGKAAEARANYSSAAADAKKLTEEVASLKIERDLARAAEKQAVEKLIAQTLANKIANDKLITDINAQHQRDLDAERNKMFRAITYALIVASVVCIIIGAFSTYSKMQTGDVFKAAMVGGVWAGAAGFCIACAWTINQSWFKWVIIIGGGCGAIGLVVYLWVEYRDAKEKKVRIKEADEAEDTIKRMMKVLDTVDPQNEVFAKLGNAMNDNNKALIKELGAEVKRATA